MKKIFSFLVCSFLIFLTYSNTGKPGEISKFVFDWEDVLSDNEEKELDSLFRAHEKRTGNEMVLITTEEYGKDADLKTYSTNLINAKGIGKKGRDNGILIVYNHKRREIRIATGFGAEKVLKDQYAKDIIDNTMIPKFREGKTFEGLWLGGKAVVDFLDKPENQIPEK